MDRQDFVPLDFSLLSDSKESTMSFVQDLNSASTLSWAEDEVENLATLGVSHCLYLLDDYLWSGYSKPENSKCFDISEADQWRNLITEFGLFDLLNCTRRTSTNEHFQLNPSQKALEIHGQRSLVHTLPAFKPNRPPTATVRTPRVRSAYLKTSTMSANPVRRGGSRSGNVNQRMPSPIHFKLQDDNSHNQEAAITVSNSRSFTPFRRANQQPPLLDGQFENNEDSILPPVNNVRNAVRNKTKPRIPNVQTSSPKWVSSNSAKRQTSGVRRIMPPLKANPPTFHNSKHDVEVSVIGTSFDPIVRPIRMKVRSNATLP